MLTTRSIPIKSEYEIKLMREAGRITSGIMQKLKAEIKPGVNAEYLNEFAEKEIARLKCTPAFKGYMGYTKSLCVSINNEVVHGVPSENKILKVGDIVSIDLGVEYKGFYGDMAVTVGVGKISKSAQHLIDVTKQALYEGIKKAISGNRLGDVSSAVQNYVEKNNYSVVRKFVGHGIGSKLHEEPEIPNFGIPNTGPELKNGMIFAIEPMVNEGSYEVEILNDGWTTVTRDGKMSSHFEHNVLIWGMKPQILTEQ
ncbi:MAG: type I methionyl aminopeptidase [Candidatus Saelkia tenebricola]|nr:type I methionyl aminopeptidase [Candidatus Saelkia tenebricola]